MRVPDTRNDIHNQGLIVGGILTMLMLLIQFCISSGCSGGGLKGEDAPEYEPLLDWDYAMGNFGFEAWKEDEFAYVENIDAIMTALGVDRVMQKDIQAKIVDETVSVRAFWEHQYKHNDKSLARAILKWDPVKPGLVKGFQEENLVGIYAISNPTELIDIFMEWFIDSGAWEEAIESCMEDTKREAKAGYGIARMTAKGLWVEAQEDYFPYIGDEIAIAVYVNRQFAGWDDYWEEESFDKMSPVHFIIAIELDRPGLSVVLKDVYEDNEGLLKEFLLAPSYDYIDYSGLPIPEEDSMELRTRKIDGEEITYIDINGLLQFGWCESDSTLFFGDLRAIENIDSYYDASNPTSLASDRYCKFTYVDGDKLVDYVIPGNTFEDMTDGLDDLSKYYGKNYINAIRNFSRELITGDKYGTFRKVFITKGEGFDVTILCTKRIADIYLSYLKVAEASKEESGQFSIIFETLFPLHFFL